MIIPRIQNPSTYDSLLSTAGVNSTTNANLYIIIKVYMNRYDPPGGSGTVQDVGGTSRNVVSWSSDSEFRAYCQNFKRVVENAWNNKLWMIPSRDWGANYLSYRPNVRCCMRISLESSAGNAHLNIRCVKLAASETSHRSSMSRRTHRGFLDNLDVQSSDNTTNLLPGITFSQIAAAHEIGHYLGLSHVNNPSCIQQDISTNQSQCYGGTHHQANDIMGRGMRVEAWHARPWRNRINQHLRLRNKLPNWRATRHRPVPVWVGRQAEVVIPPEMLQ